MNLHILESHFENGAEITPEILAAKGLITDLLDGLKVLATGEVSKKFTVHAHKFSESAQEKLQAVGGTANLLEAVRR